MLPTPVESAGLLIKLRELKFTFISVSSVDEGYSFPLYSFVLRCYYRSWTVDKNAASQLDFGSIDTSRSLGDSCAKASSSARGR